MGECHTKTRKLSYRKDDRAMGPIEHKHDMHFIHHGAVAKIK